MYLREWNSCFNPESSYSPGTNFNEAYSRNRPIAELQPFTRSGHNSVTAAVILTYRLPFIALVQLGFQMIYKN